MEEQVSATNYTAAKAAERAQQNRDDAMQIAANMVDSVEAQDEAIKGIAQAVRVGVDGVNEIAKRAEENSLHAHAGVLTLKSRMDAFEGMTLLERLTWLFRGQV